MRRVVLVAAAWIIVLVLAGGALAASGPGAGTFGINVGMGNSMFNDPAVQGSLTTTSGAYIHGVINISGKYFASDDLALIAGFGFQKDGSDADATYYNLSAGIRKFLKRDDLSTFLEGRFVYESLEVDDTFIGNLDMEVYDLSANIGAEYFFHKQFSLEGSVGIGAGTVKVNSADTKDTYFGTRTIGVSANFYF
jgi:hypothetical protein